MTKHTDTYSPELAFTSLSANGLEAERYAVLSKHFIRLARELGELCPPGRYLALARTDLEKSAMWANKAIAHERAVLEAVR